MRPQPPSTSPFLVMRSHGSDLHFRNRPTPDYDPDVEGGTGVSYNLNDLTTETTTPLAAAASFTGASHDTSAWSYVRFRVLAASDKAGTVYVEQSDDQVNWFQTSEEAPVITDFTEASIVVESLITMRYVRAAYVNGATAQTDFVL